MLAPLLNSLGDRNPQLLRELKSRFRGRGVVTALVLSAIAQLLLLTFARTGMESTPWQYCSVSVPDDQLWTDAMWALCTTNGEPYGPIDWTQIDWSKWWLEVLTFMNWAMPIVLTGLGMYMLIGDLQQEEQRGTLNFIRLSPRKSANIFWGKLLGVPVLVYVGIGAMLPLHLWAAISARASAGFLASYYSLFVLDALLFFCLAMVVGLLAPRAAKAQGRTLLAGGVTLAVPFLCAAMLVPYHFLSRQWTVWHGFSQFMYGQTSWKPKAWQWFGLQFDQQSWVAHGVQWLFLGVAGFWLWRVLRRAYQRPNATPISKRQSYGIVISGFVLLLGLFSPFAGLDNDTAVVGMVLFMLSVWFGGLILIATLLPDRQTLLDWVHTRRMQAPAERSSLIKELCLGERSPGIIALVLNLVLMGGMGFVYLTQIPTLIEGYRDDMNMIQLGLLLTLLLIAMYGALAQLMLFLKTPKRMLWAVGSVALAMVLPLLCGAIVSIGDSSSGLAQALFLISPVPWLVLAKETTEPFMVGGAILLQCLILWGLLWRLSSALNRAELLMD